MDGVLDVQVPCRSLDLSSSSDEHHLPHSFWAQACGLENQNTFVIIVHLGSIGISIVLFLRWYAWREQYHSIATSGTVYLGPRNYDNFGLCALVNWPQYHDT